MKKKTIHDKPGSVDIHVKIIIATCHFYTIIHFASWDFVGFTI